jgi:uncharacterized repeat protein (TIGR03803 family)
MKTDRLSFQAAIVVLISIASTLPLNAQKYTVLHDFGTNVMGAYPNHAPVLGADGFLYGVTSDGGTANRGQIFRFKPDGSDYTVLKDFSGGDGAWPRASLVVDGVWLYGTTQRGGPTNLGTVFKLQTNGANFTILRQFSGDDGAFPEARVLLAGGTIYGATSGGGPDNEGVVFKMNTDGTGFILLKTFSMDTGAYPQGGLVMADSSLYGTTYEGGTNGGGILFSVQTDGSSFFVVKDFSEFDGLYPAGDLVLDGNVLYGTTSQGGTSANGTVFKVNIDGSNYEVLHDFGDQVQGALPWSGLLQIGSTLYGTTSEGGIRGGGTVFRLETDGSGFEVLKDFADYTSDGAFPIAALIAAGSDLLGAVAEGGAFNHGGFFRLGTNGAGFTRIFDFVGGDGGLALDLALSGTNLFGITEGGGASGGGTVFKLNTDGSGYTVIKHFTNLWEGIQPNGLPLIDGETIYGSTTCGGAADGGTLFKLNTDGSGFVVLKDFTNALAGGNPSGELILIETNLYGTTRWGGISNLGTVFRISTNGTDHTVLKHFTGSDGRYPNSGLVRAGDLLYGTTLWGGTNDYGIIFALTIAGDNFIKLRDCSDLEGGGPSSLLIATNTIYGTTEGGGNGCGTIFTMTTDGSGFMSFQPFDWTTACLPRGKLCLVGSTLFGVAGDGGPGGGAIFQINTDGSNFHVLKNFSGIDGSYPQCISSCLLLSGATLFGTTTEGSQLEHGVVFALSLLPEIGTVLNDRTMEVGGDCWLTLPARGSPPLGYFWLLNGTNVSAASDTNHLHLTNLAFAQSGDYCLVVTNAFGATTSAPVRLSVIPVVERRSVPAITVSGETGSLLTLDYANELVPAANWLPLGTVSLAGASSVYFDITSPLPPQRFYRAWQTGTSGTAPTLSGPLFVPALTLTGNPGDKIRVEGINACGPTDAWFTLADVTRTNSPQLYFDLSALGQPARLYRLTVNP